jgi:hypothetical protein
MTTFLNSIIRDLNEKRLMLPLIAIAACAIVVPALLISTAGNGSAPGPLRVAGVTGTPSGVPTPAQVLAAVANTGTAKATVYHGNEKNPFLAPSSPASSTSGGSSSKSGGSSSGGGSSSSSGSSSGSSGGSTSGSSGGSGGSSSKPAVNGGLTDTQTFVTTFVVNGTSGGEQLADAERLTVLPWGAQPEAVYYGVMKGGSSVALIVLPGYTATGGTCEPGPTDCEMVEIAPGQTATVEPLSAAIPSGQTGQTGSSGDSGDGSSSPVGVAQAETTTFTVAVASVGKADHSSPQATQQARAVANKQGASLLSDSHLLVLDLFTYDQGAGYVTNDNTASVGG